MMRFFGDRHSVYKIVVLFLFFVASLSVLLSNSALGTTIAVGSLPYDIAVDPGLNKIYVANNNDNTVSVINGTTNTVVATIPVGSLPTSIRVNTATHMIYIANVASNSVTAINGTTNTVVATISVSFGPDGIGINSKTNKVYVANVFSGTVAVINGTTNTVVATIPVGGSPAGVAVDQNSNRVYVAGGFSNTLSVIDGATNTFTNILVGAGLGGIDVDSNTHKVYLAIKSLSAISVINSTNNVIDMITVGRNPTGVATDQNNHLVYVTNTDSNTVSVINSTTNKVLTIYPSNSSPGGIAVNANTHTVYVANRGSNTVFVLAPSGNIPPIANAGSDQIVSPGNLVTLNGRNSTDFDGDSITFQWTQTAGPTVHLSSTTTANPTFTAPTVNLATLLTFQLVVNDGIFNSVPATVNVVDNPITTFTIPLSETNGTFTGNVGIGNIFNGTIVALRYQTATGTLPSAQFQQTIIPSGVDKTNVSFNVTESSKIPLGLPSPPINTATFFSINSEGVDFSNPSNFAKNQSPKTKFVVANNFTSSQRFPDNCPVIPLELFNDTTENWNQVGNPQVPQDNKIYVGNTASNTISVIDSFTNTVIHTITFAGGVHEVGVDPATNHLYASNPLSNTLSVIDGSSDSIVSSIPVGISPIGVAVDSIGHKVYVANFGSNSVTEINSTSNSIITTIPVGSGPIEVAADSGTNRAYSGNIFSNSVSVIDTASNKVVATVPVGTLPTGLTVDPITHNVYVANLGSDTVSIINSTTNTVTATIPVGFGPATTAVDPGANVIYVANSISNTVSVIDRTFNVVTKTIPVGNSPIIVSVNPSTNRVYTTNQNSNTISIIDGLPGSPTRNTVISTIPVGLNPIGIAVNPIVPNPVRDPSTDIKDNTGKILQCAYIATHPHLSKFAIGGIVSALAALGAHGGNSASTQAFSVQGFVDLKSLSSSAQDSILNQDPYVPLKPSNDPTVPYYPFSLGGNNYLLARYANTIQTVTASVGVPINLQLASPDTTISHVALYTNMEGLNKEIGDSDTYIMYDKGSPLQIVDPHGFFSDVKIKTTTDNNIEKFGFTITFAKPMPTSDIFVREWDESKYSSDTKIKDAIGAIESVQNTQTSKDLISANATTISPTPLVASGNLTNYIKQWGGYSSTSISDSQLLSTMGLEGKHIPSWFMKTTKWFVDGETSQQEFVSALKYMSEAKIVK